MRHLANSRRACRPHGLARRRVRSTANRGAPGFAFPGSIRSRHDGSAECSRSSRYAAGRAAQPVKDVAAQRVTRWKSWMLEIEVFGRLVGHPELFHYPTRCAVRRNSESDDFIQSQPAKSVADRRARRLMRVALAQ